jgi:hypothetical protein
VLVEVGVLSGGSLFMWRELLGPNARIIGVDANPEAKKWGDFGFEIAIGDQGDERFWEHFFQGVGRIDVLIDDGGHTFNQQITTTMAVLPMIHNGGLLVVEDTHTSYMEGYGNTKYSFMNWVYAFCDEINHKFSALASGILRNETSGPVWAVSIFESIVGFHVDRGKASLGSHPMDNGKTRDSAQDIRVVNYASSRIERVLAKLGFLRALPLSNLIRSRLRNFLQAETKSLKKLFGVLGRAELPKK